MRDHVQLKNPRTKEWVLLDKSVGRIVDTSKRKFAGVDVAKNKEA